jgi:LysR family transcriptional regulator, glycine cleavage system transcriptional activator
MTNAPQRMNAAHALQRENAPMRRLPPFAELVAFEAVARHLSFTRAAEELCLTQSAVSHRVRRLEQHLGGPLIRRLNPGLVLTESGTALLPGLVAALDGLAQLGQPAERRLRVAAGSALCTWWLAGRLPGFMARRPGVSIELMPMEQAQAAIPHADVRILWVAPGEEPRGPTQLPLFNEQVFPVCSPKLLPGGKPLRDAQALARLPLLHKATHGLGEWSWPVWLERLGGPSGAKPSSELRFADMGLVLSAAVDGAGVAIARSLLVHDALVSGRLVVPLVGVTPMRSTKKHVARWPAAKAADPDIRAFVEWLSAEAALTLAAVEPYLRGDLGLLDNTAQSLAR